MALLISDEWTVLAGEGAVGTALTAKEAAEVAEEDRAAGGPAAQRRHYRLVPPGVVFEGHSWLDCPAVERA